MKRIFGTTPAVSPPGGLGPEPVDMLIRYRNGTGRHEMIR